uniref:PH domain-containing protein n=1 Tax=Mycena chlorophos TaxID=658473 RepID=A0ABQ0LAA7_MYCCL|nr:predicted protein [Mycena chlorophos]
MQVRPTQSAFQLRASKLFQKVSSKFTRSSPDPGGTHPQPYEGPYMRNAYSMDASVKPYMSQPVLGLMLAPVEDNGDSDGSDSPIRAEVPLPHRPPAPSRAIPPAPLSVEPVKELRLNTTNSPPVNLPIITPPTPISPTEHAQPLSESSDTRRASLPPLRRARSQTLSDGRNWSRPSSTVFGASAQSALSMGLAVALGDATQPMTTRIESSMSISTISSASSYATAQGSVLSTSSTIDPMSGRPSAILTGLPVLDRRETVRPQQPVEGLPPQPVDGLPPGAAHAVDPHHYSPVSVSTMTPPLTPSEAATPKIQPAPFKPAAAPSPSTSRDPRRSSVASFASVTSVDSFATARSGGWSEDEADGENPDEDDEGGQTPTVGDEAMDVVMPLELSGLSRESTLRGGQPPARERAETLRGNSAASSVLLNSPTTSKIDINTPSTPTATRSPAPSSNTPSPTNTAIPSSNAMSTTITYSPTTDAPPSPKGPFSPRSTMRTASLPPISTIPLVLPATPVPTQPPRSSVLLRASPSAGNLGGSGSPITPRTRTASAGYTPSPTSRSNTTSGTLPSRRPPSIPMSLHRYSMTFNPGAPLSPGESDMGRLSPSIIVRQPPLAIPVLKLPSISSPVVERPPAHSETVGRRSSVIFGPHGTHERETSKAVVRSMPALAMEGPSGLDRDTHDSDSENDDDIVGDEDGDEMDGEDDDESQNHSVDARNRDETESPFVPLRLDTTLFSLELGGLGLGLGPSLSSKGKGKERETAPLPFPVQSQSSQSSSKVSVLSSKTPMPAQHMRPSDYFSPRSPTGDGRTPLPVPSSPKVPRTVPMPPLPSPAGERPGMYKHASRSMVDLFVPLVEPEEEKPAAKEDERGEAPAYDGHGMQRASTIKRRRSMPEVSAAPPPYTSPLFLADAGLHPLAQIRITPREDEGREVLPPYSNSILLRSIMPRKMEFSAPGIQAKDRKWRRVLCELEGTAFRVYRCQGEGWWERRVGVRDIAQSNVGNAAAAAAAALKARGGASQASQENKLAQEEALLAPPSEGLAGDTGSTTELMLAPRSSISSSRSRASSTATSISQQPPSSASSVDGSPTASRSKLNLGLGLLKARSHGRSKSDLPNPPRSPVSSRSSLSIPRPSFSGTSSAPISEMPTVGSSQLATSRSSTSLASSVSRTPASAAKGKQKAPSLSETDVPEPDPNDLIRAYTLQHAESGLGNDYLKRKHVIRVRLEGEQFLLQARDVGDVVDWIEGLHCATNIALDLDERPMPKGPLFPRRRRRRNRPGTATASGAGSSEPPAVPPATT